METPQIPKQLVWLGSARDDLRALPASVVYTVKFADVVYVLHVFQKKSIQGRSTSQRDIDLIKARLQWAQEHYAQWQRTHANPRQ